MERKKLKTSGRVYYSTLIKIWRGMLIIWLGARIELWCLLRRIGWNRRKKEFVKEEGQWQSAKCYDKSSLKGKSCGKG